MENPKVVVTVKSWLNYDGFECDGKSYKLDQLNELAEQVAGREIVWAKGRNTFMGGTISDKFFASMIMRYVNRGRKE